MRPAFNSHKNQVTLILVIIALLLSNLLFPSPACADTPSLIITGVIDGPITGGLPKAVELYVVDDIVDLSSYGLGSANNGGGSDGEEFTFPADSVSGGTFIYISYETTTFNTWFGFNPDYTDNAVQINGDDAIELFHNGSVIDVFGNINVDGTGEAWEYMDGWAYRNSGTDPDGSTFTIGDWYFSGPNALDGETSNATATTPFPTGTYSLYDFDGNITESYWNEIVTSSGGPAPGFGSGHEINALHTDIVGDNVYIGIAGNVQDGNRILLFIDSISGGFNTATFDRTNAPQGIDDFNSGTTFDSGFAPDYALVIGTNSTHDNFFFDLYTLDATTGSNNFLGDSDGTVTLGANPANSSTTQGFEVLLSKASGTGDIEVTQNMSFFATYISDGGYLSNQFLAPANSGEGNYGDGAITFGAAVPDPVGVGPTAVTLSGLSARATSPALLVGGVLLLGAVIFWRRRRQ
jgi:hypothetical protein